MEIVKSLGMTLVYCLGLTHTYKMVDNTTYIVLVDFQLTVIPFHSQTLPRSLTNAKLTFEVLAVASSSMFTALERAFPNR